MFRSEDALEQYARRKCEKFCSSFVVADGFDVYASVADAGTGNGANGWTSTGIGTFSTITRFGYGRSWRFNNQNGLGFLKTGCPNESTWFIHVSCMMNNFSASFPRTQFVQLRDAGTPQLTITFNSTSPGSIELHSGGETGTVLASWSPAFVPLSFDSYQFKVVVHNSAGEFHIRKNGATSDNFAVTGLDTAGGTVNNYANEIAIGHTEGTTGVFFDDFYSCTGDATTPNDWTGDIRAFQCQGIYDTAQKQFTITSVGSLAFGSTDNSTPSSLGVIANRIQCDLVGTGFATQGGTFTSITAEFNGGFTANVKFALYLADGDVQGFNSDARPGTLIAVSNTLVNPVTGPNTVTFPGTVGVMKGYTYFWGVLSDANLTFKTNGNVGIPAGYQYSTPFAGGFPTSLATLTVSDLGSRPYTIYTTLTATNAGCTSDEIEDGVTTFVNDNVVGHYDLYDLFDLTYTPAAILGVTLRAMVAKSDSGGRGFKIAGKSGATAFETFEYNPLTTFSYMCQHYTTDPDTGSAWTVSAVNALQAGPKISS